MPLITAPKGDPGPTFNGGTITTPLVIAPTNPASTALRINLAANAGNDDAQQILMYDENGVPIVSLFADGSLAIDAAVWGGAFSYTLASGRSFAVQGGGLDIVKVDGAGTIGFYNHAPAAQQVVPLTTPTVQNVIDALVATGLIVQHD